MRLEASLLAAGAVMGSFCACAPQQPARASAASEPSTLNATAVEIARAVESLRGRTRSDVIAALGPANVIRFDSGYEVWVYRFVETAPGKPAHKDDNRPALRDQRERDRPPSELVMLFTPSGVLTKVRVRSPVPDLSLR